MDLLNITIGIIFCVVAISGLIYTMRQSNEMVATRYGESGQAQDKNYFYPGNQIAITFTKDLEKEFTVSILKQNLDLITQLVELREIGTKVFDGNVRSFKYWLRAYVPALKVKPIDILDQPGGIERVRTLLLQMELGIVP